MAKYIRDFLENFCEYYFLNIVVTVNLYSDLKFEYYCEYNLKTRKPKKTQIHWRDPEIFSKTITGP